MIQPLMVCESNGDQSPSSVIKVYQSLEYQREGMDHAIRLLVLVKRVRFHLDRSPNGKEAGKKFEERESLTLNILRQTRI